ncbi:MAG: DUF2835 family protein [Glaciecola sp.]
MGNKNHKRYTFSINLSYADCEDLYKQHIKFLMVTDDNGKRIQLPKDNMKRFVTPIGLKGRFELLTDINHKILTIKPLDTPN